MRRLSCSNQSACRLLSMPATCTLSQRIWSFRSASRDSGSPSAGRSARWSLTIPARVRRSRSLAVTGAVIRSPYPQYAGCGGLCIGRTPDGSDGAGLRTLAVDGKYLLEDSDAPNDPRGLPQVTVDQVAVQVHRHAGHGPPRRARPATGTSWRLYLPHHRWQAHRGLEEVMKRAVRRTLLSAGLAGVVTAVTVAATVAPSWATPPVRAGERPFGAWHQHVTWDHPA